MPSRVADILMQQGATQARLWETLGQVPGQVYAGVQAQKLRQLQEREAGLDIEGRTLDVEARRRQRDATRVLADIMRDTPRTKHEGLSLWDVPTISQRMGEQGFGPEADIATQHLEAGNESLRRHQEGRVAAIQRGAQSLQAAGNDPRLAEHFLDQIEENEVYSKDTVQKYREFIRADPGNVAKLTALLAGPEPVSDVQPGGTLMGRRTGTVVGRGAPRLSSEIDLLRDAATVGTPQETPTARISQATLEKQQALRPKHYEQKSVLLDGKPAEVRFDPATGKHYDASGTDVSARVQPIPPAKHYEQKSVLLDGKPAEVHFDPATGKHYDASGADVSARVKPIPPASTVINPALLPSGDALDMAARRYLATGDLPPMGMGTAGVAARIAIMNAAAKIDPQASLAANRATYRADSANLTRLQTTEGTLSAFEKTAGKNLDQFLALADKIPDTGVPWLNTPVRLLTRQLVGQENMAAITAARDVALREIARVTNDPRLSGALTDTARREVLGLSPANATLPQIKAVAKVLKQDMANVHQGLTQQISAVKAALTSHPGADAGAVEEWMRDATGKLVRKP